MVQTSSNTMDWKERLFEAAVFRSWWVLLFILFCYVCHDQALKKRSREISHLKTNLLALEDKKKRVLGEHEDLVLKIQSQSDPAWIEMILMKELGVVPEGYMKVHFTNHRS